MPTSYLLRNAIFDIDGTLVDSAGDIRGAIAQAYTAIGIEGLAGKIDKIVIGPPLAEMVKQLTPDLAEEQYEALVAAFRAAYDASPLDKTEVYAGVWDVMRKLRDSNAKLLVATNKPALATRRVLAKTGLQACFLDVVTPDAFAAGKASKTEMVRHLIGKWRLDRDVTFVFGDAVSDLEAARQNGVGSVAVLSGYGKREELMGCQPTVALESMGGLLSCGQFHFR
jgi:phosphoglycolate phosphatase